MPELKQETCCPNTHWRYGDRRIFVDPDGKFRLIGSLGFTADTIAAACAECDRLDAAAKPMEWEATSFESSKYRVTICQNNKWAMWILNGDHLGHANDVDAAKARCEEHRRTGK